MTNIVLVILFIAQLVSFACIALLNSKIAKFTMIEQNQESLMREMEDTFSVYLIEMKEENDRLIQELSHVKEMNAESKSKSTRKKPNAKKIHELHPQLEDSALNLSALKDETPTVPVTTQLEQVIEPKKMVAKAFAANAYKKNASPSSPTAIVAEKVVQAKIEPVDEVLVTFEQQVVNYYKDGLSIEEIAKKTQKGRTEIELLIKFHA